LRGQENRKRVERLTFLSSGRVKIIIYKAGTKTVSKYIKTHSWYRKTN